MNRTTDIRHLIALSMVVAVAPGLRASAGDENVPSPLEAVCKVSTRTTTGSGVVYRQDSDHYFIVTARHLVQLPGNTSAASATLQFFHAGWASKLMPATVEFLSEPDDDIAILAVHKQHFSAYRAPAVLPLRSEDTKDGERIMTVGVSRSSGDPTSWPTSRLGRITDVPNHVTVCFLPATDPEHIGGGLVSDDGRSLLGICTAGGMNPVGSHAIPGSRLLNVIPANLQ